ncbi:Uncharacterised protein at_DN1225 [Pycnogonum litorale]
MAVIVKFVRNWRMYIFSIFGKEANPRKKVEKDLMVSVTAMVSISVASMMSISAVAVSTVAISAAMMAVSAISAAVMSVSASPTANQMFQQSEKSVGAGNK